jgi:hypothetical protein
MEFVSRKRKVTFLDEVRDSERMKVIKPNPKFTSFHNVFLMGNKRPFFERSRVLPIISNVSENNTKRYKHHIQYISSNSVLYEKYSMDDEIVFSITMGSEELIIPQVRKSKDKSRNVYVNGIKRIESKYNKDGIEYELKCFNEDGKKIVFSRKMETLNDVTSFISYKYDLDGNIIKKWIE